MSSSSSGSYFPLMCCMSSEPSRCHDDMPCLPRRRGEAPVLSNSDPSRNSEISQQTSGSFNPFGAAFGTITSKTFDRCSKSGAFKDPEEVFEICQKRYQKNNDAIDSLAKVSPLKVITAEEAIKFFASKVDKRGKHSLDKKQFTALLQDLIQTSGAGKINHWQSDLAKVFNVFDFDQTGTLEYFHWLSAIPLFFGGSADSSGVISGLIFAELDLDDSGELDFQEFSNYFVSKVNMMVPPGEPKLRDEMRERLARRVFKMIDLDESGSISVEEFSEWLRWNSLEVSTFKALDACVFIRGHRSSHRKNSRRSSSFADLHCATGTFSEADGLKKMHLV